MKDLGERLVRGIYAAAMRAAAPLYLHTVRRRGLTEPLYAEAIGERIGIYTGPAPRPGSIWLHAVSLGETRAAAPLVAALREALPARPLLLTHGTATGRAAGQPLLAGGDAQAWLPWDEPSAVGRFFDRFAPALGVLMETEIWPNLLAEASRRRVPMLLANARMSARSRFRFEFAAALLGPAYRSLAAVFAQADADAAHLREVGAVDVRVAGNLKFDVAVSPELLDRGRRWREAVGARAVVLAASAREGEEEALLAAWRAVPPPRPLLAIVPRHPQRFDAVAALVDTSGFSFVRRSHWSDGDDGPPPDAASAEVWLGDSLLEMPAWYALADVALLGGSFAPLGGQNLIEAAACACPVVMGPHTFNFGDAAEGALAAGAAVRVANLEAGVDAALRLVSGNDRDAMSQAALGFTAQHRGAAARIAAQIMAIVAKQGASSPSSAGSGTRASSSARS